MLWVSSPFCCMRVVPQVAQLQTLRSSLTNSYGKGPQELLLELLLLEAGLAEPSQFPRGTAGGTQGRLGAVAAGQQLQTASLSRRAAESVLLVVVSAGEGFPMVPG